MNLIPIYTTDNKFGLLISAVENNKFNKRRHISHWLLFDIPQQFLHILQQNHASINEVI